MRPHLPCKLAIFQLTFTGAPWHVHLVWKLGLLMECHWKDTSVTEEWLIRELRGACDPELSGALARYSGFRATPPASTPLARKRAPRLSDRDGSDRTRSAGMADRLRGTGARLRRSAERGLFTIRSPVWWRQAQEADAVFASLDPAFVGRIARGILDVDPQKFTRTLPLSDAGIESILLALRAELIDGCPGGRYYGESLATALAARLLWFSGKTSRSSRIGGLMPGRLRRILDYIDANLASDTTVERLAAHSKMIPRQFARLFLQNMGVTPHQYVVRRRTNAAKDLLRDSQLSLAEIGYIVGFPTQAHFTTTFRKRVGVTPSAFRKIRSST